MYKLCKTEQSAKRQREIEGALFGLLMKKSYSDITVTEICDVLSMPRKAFYRYFDSKDDTLYALIEHTMAEYNDFSASLDESKVRTLKREIEKYFAFWKDHKLLLDALYKSSELGEEVKL